MRNLLQISIVFIFTLSIFSNPANSGEDDDWMRHAPPPPTLSEDDDAGDEASAAASHGISPSLFSAENLGTTLLRSDSLDSKVLTEMGHQWDQAMSLHTDIKPRVLEDELKFELDRAFNRYRDMMLNLVRYYWKHGSAHASDERRKLLNAFKRKIFSILERQSQHSGAPQAALSPTGAVATNPLFAVRVGHRVVRVETQHNGSTVVTIVLTVGPGQ